MTSGPLAFTKLEGLGNDFVLIDARGGSPVPDGPIARRIADRRLGVGCDQVLVLTEPSDRNALCRVIIFNADGSRAEQCGNGMRAIGLWLRSRGLMGDSGTLQTDGGPVGLEAVSGGLIRASLQAPRFGTKPGDLELPAPALAGHWLSMGNPHLVLEWPRSPGHEELLTFARPLAESPALADGVNVGLAHVVSGDRIELRVYERGAGPTPACGSGACAAACALLRSGGVTSPVSVSQPGGILVIHWSGHGEPVLMTGPATTVFEGTLEWPSILERQGQKQESAPG